MTVSRTLRDSVPRHIRKLFDARDAHPTLRALGMLELRHLPHLTPAAFFEAAESAGMDDDSLDCLEAALEASDVQSAFGGAGIERPLLSEEAVALFMRAASPTSTMPNVIHIDKLAERLLRDVHGWTVPPKLLNLAFCRVGTAVASIKGIVDTVTVVLQARRRLNATDDGLIVDLSVNELDNCDEACQCVADMAGWDGIAYIVIVGQDLAKSVELHRMLWENGHLNKVVSLLHNVLVGGRFPGSEKLRIFADNTMTADARHTYKSIREHFEALHRSVQTPKTMAEAALNAAVTHLQPVECDEMGDAQQAESDASAGSASGGESTSSAVGGGPVAPHAVRPGLRRSEVLGGAPPLSLLPPLPLPEGQAVTGSDRSDALLKS